MKNYAKVFAPVMLAILVGSLTFIFGQSKDDQDSGAPQKRPPRGEDFRLPPPNRGGLPPVVLDKLNLTAAQKEQIEAFQTGARDTGKEFFEKVRTADEQLRKLVEAGNFSEENARQILNTKAVAMTEIELVRLRADAVIIGVLSAEQKAQLAELKEKRPRFPPGDKFRPREQ